jgi:16S rRNA (uracil1498-N3)-methyltransferase
VAGPLAGKAVELDAARAHFLRNVLRLGPGDAVAVFNARDGEFAARIETLGKRGATLAPGERLRAPAPEPGPWLCFAPIKRARVDLLVEKATELGAARLLPVVTRRTVVERVNLERLAAIATEAAEQTGRLSVPDVAAPVALPALLASWPADRALVVCDETGGGTPIAAALRGRRDALALLTGPEGGFAPEEIEWLTREKFVRRVGLGPRILRADTAAIAALAVLQAVAGDANETPAPLAGAVTPA